MTNVIRLTSTNATRGSSSAEKKRPAQDAAALIFQAERIEAAIAEQPILQSAKERLKLAENVWDLLEEAIRRKPTLTKAKILQQAGQGQSHESTKRLVYFAVDPALPVDKRDARSGGLRKHVAKYARIAKEAAALSGMNPHEATITLARGTRYERQVSEASSAPFDNALADIQTALERLLEQMTASPDVERYFKLLRQHKLTLQPASPTTAEPQDLPRFVSQPGAWATTYVKDRARHFVSHAVTECVPKAWIGRGHLATVDGSLELKTGADVRALIGGNDAESPAGRPIRLKAYIDFKVDVALSVCAFDEPGRPLPALLLRPAVRIRLHEKAPSVHFLRGEGTKDQDWAFFNDFYGPDPVAGSVVFSKRSEPHCTLEGFEGDEVLEKGLVTYAYYDVDVPSALDDFIELEQPSGTEWLVEPLTVSAQRKWLLREMHDDDVRVDVALPRWLDSGAAPDRMVELFEKLGSQVEKEWLRDKTPADRKRHQHRKELASRVRELLRQWRDADYFAPVSCPEGTLAAAIERGVFGGPSFLAGPHHVIRNEFAFLSRDLNRDIEAISKRRKDLLKEISAEDLYGPQNP